MIEPGRGHMSNLFATPTPMRPIQGSVVKGAFGSLLCFSGQAPSDQTLSMHSVVVCTR
jgi:hypothetical protein